MFTDLDLKSYTGAEKAEGSAAEKRAAEEAAIAQRDANRAAVTVNGYASGSPQAVEVILGNQQVPQLLAAPMFGMVMNGLQAQVSLIFTVQMV
jgi:hypothetical protein